MTLLFSVSQTAISHSHRSQLGGAARRFVHRVHLLEPGQGRVGQDLPAQLGVVAVQPDDQRLVDVLGMFEADPETELIVMCGEIGGDAEERAADYIKANVTKPVVGYVAGFTAPEGKTMGHAGAIISGSAGTAQAKKEALEKAGVRVGKTPSETAALAREIYQSLGK